MCGLLAILFGMLLRHFIQDRFPCLIHFSKHFKQKLCPHGVWMDFQTKQHITTPHKTLQLRFIAPVHSTSIEVMHKYNINSFTYALYLCPLHSESRELSTHTLKHIYLDLHRMKCYRSTNNYILEMNSLEMPKNLKQNPYRNGPFRKLHAIRTLEALADNRQNITRVALFHPRGFSNIAFNLPVQQLLPFPRLFRLRQGLIGLDLPDFREEILLLRIGRRRSSVESIAGAVGALEP